MKKEKENTLGLTSGPARVFKQDAPFYLLLGTVPSTPRVCPLFRPTGLGCIAQWFLHPPPLVILRSALLTTPAPPTNTSYPSPSHSPAFLILQNVLRSLSASPGQLLSWQPRLLSPFLELLFSGHLGVAPPPFLSSLSLGSLHLESSRSHCVLASPVLTLEDAI